MPIFRYKSSGFFSLLNLVGQPLGNSAIPLLALTPHRNNDDYHDRHHHEHNNFDDDEDDQIHDHNQGRPSRKITRWDRPPSDLLPPTMTCSHATPLVGIFRAAGSWTTARKNPTDGDDIKSQRRKMLADNSTGCGFFWQMLKVGGRKAYPPGEMTAFPISTLVNSPRNERPECIVRASA
jgi:hypothetical protein